MGKLSIPRLALAMMIFGIFLLPPTDSFAAATWLEKLFPSQPHKAPKHRKPRAAKKVATPLTAPVPAAKPDNEPPVEEMPQSSDVIPAPPPAAAPVTKPASPVQGSPMPQPKPAVPADNLPDDAGTTPEENTDAVPIPEPDPRVTSENKQPSQRPAGPVQGPPMPPALEASPQDKAPPKTVPIPEPNPRTATEKPDEAAPVNETAPADVLPEPMLPDPRSAVRPDPSGKLPPEELACRERLAALGVKFREHAAESDPEGCAIPYPLTVKSLGTDIGLKPEAEMNCAMTEAAARFMKDVVSPAAQAEFGQPLKSITHASAYVCRPRNGTRKLSEHAFGNALDIGSFTLSDGTMVEVEPTPPEKPATFLGKVRAAACGPFKTVLGPGDPDHALHFHFDLAPRRHGGTVCQ